MLPHRHDTVDGEDSSPHLYCLELSQSACEAPEVTPSVLPGSGRTCEGARNTTQLTGNAEGNRQTTDTKPVVSFYFIPFIHHTLKAGP